MCHRCGFAAEHRTRAACIEFVRDLLTERSGAYGERLFAAAEKRMGKGYKKRREWERAKT